MQFALARLVPVTADFVKLGQQLRHMPELFDSAQLLKSNRRLCSQRRVGLNMAGFEHADIMRQKKPARNSANMLNLADATKANRGPKGIARVPFSSP